MTAWSKAHPSYVSVSRGFCICDDDGTLTFGVRKLCIIRHAGIRLHTACQVGLKLYFSCDHDVSMACKVL